MVEQKGNQVKIQVHARENENITTEQQEIKRKIQTSFLRFVLETLHENFKEIQRITKDYKVIRAIVQKCTEFCGAKKQFRTKWGSCR